MRTQTVVELRADARVVSEANNLHVEVLSATGAVLFARDLNPQGNDFPGFPVLFPLSLRGDDESRIFELRAVATSQRRSVDGAITTMPIAQNRLRTSFRRGHVLRVALWLLSGCRCNTETERCEPDDNGDLVPECVPIVLDPNASDGAVTDSMRDAGVDGALFETGVICSAGQRVCGDQCVSRSSPVACGPSCTPCSSLLGGEAVCEDDACSIRCGTTTPNRCPNSCANLDNDRDNCGACGRACTGSQVCVNRDCVAPPRCTIAQDPACTGPTYCNLATQTCSPGCDGRSGQCLLGQTCDAESNTCVCASGTRNCGNACATCPSGANIAGVGCQGNACIVQSCHSGFVRNSANTSCIDIDECSVNNGDCGAASCANTSGSFTCTCSAPNRTCNDRCVPCPTDANATTTLCSAGTCVVGACRSGFSPNALATACQVVGSAIFSGPPVVINGAAGTPSSFGQSISLSQAGDTLAIGYPSSGGGAVLVATRSANAWTGATIARPTSAAYFGTSVSLSQDGNTLAVGDPGPGGVSGFATTYTRTNSNWNNGTAVARPEVVRRFGASVSLRGDALSLVVGDNGGGSDAAGSVTVHTRTGNTWSAGVAVPRPGGVRQFGLVVAVADTILAVGDPLANDFGAVTVYVRQGSGWSGGVSVARPDTARHFGRSMGLSRDGNTLVVGDYDGGAGGNGSATVYARSGSTWSAGTNLTPPAGAAAFGSSVSLSQFGNTIVVGDPDGGENRDGSATVFVRSGSTWTTSADVARPAGARGFGATVCLSGDGSTLAVADPDGPTSAGSVSVYTR